MDALFQDFRIIAFLNACRNVFNHIGKVVLNSKVHRLLAVSTSAVQLDSFVVLSFELKVIG